MFKSYPTCSFNKASSSHPSLVCSYPHPFLVLVPQKRHKHMPYFHSFFTLEPFSYRSATWLTLSLALCFRTAERDQLTACLTQWCSPSIDRAQDWVEEGRRHIHWANTGPLLFTLELLGCKKSSDLRYMRKITVFCALNPKNNSSVENHVLRNARKTHFWSAVLKNWKQGDPCRNRLWGSWLPHLESKVDQSLKRAARRVGAIGGRQPVKEKSSWFGVGSRPGLCTQRGKESHWMN